MGWALYWAEQFSKTTRDGWKALVYCGLDRGHCYEHLKKIKLRWKLSSDIYLNVCVCNEFWAARNVKKVNFEFSRPQPASVGAISSIFVCKSSFRIISMIKIVILDQGKPISLIFEKIKSKFQKSEICT